MKELDRKVAEALGYVIENRSGVNFWIDPNKPSEKDFDKFFADLPVSSVLTFEPSTNWQQCGELIERFDISVFFNIDEWVALIKSNSGRGKTPLEAVCRAVIAMQEGEG